MPDEVSASEDVQEIAERPILERLFFHPLAEEDGVTASSETLDTNRPFYEGWHADHLGRPRFYIRGGKRARVVLQTLDAKPYYNVASRALELIRARTDWASYGGDWSAPAYNQFTRAFGSKPVTLERAVTVIGSMEVLYSDAVASGRLNGNALDLYKIVSIVPACYNVDDFTPEVLERIRAVTNGTDTLLRACSQRASKILDELAGGHTVTRTTALRIQQAIQNSLSMQVGTIRPYPGAGGLGMKAAAPSELVRFD
jgi:hypothetical protein